MSWLIASISVALITAVTFILVKKILQKHSYLEFLFISFASALPAMAVIVILTGKIPEVTPVFYRNIIISSTLDLIAFIAVAIAVKKSAVSLIAPISSLTPAFVIVTAWLFLNESISSIGIAGVLFVVLGSYLLNLSDIKKGLLVPLNKLASNQGVRLTFAAAVIWSITPLFQKSAIFETNPQNPMFTSFAGFLLLTIYTAILAFLKKINIISKFREQSRLYITIGVLTALSQFLSYYAFSIAPLAYATSIFRLSTFATIVLGAIFLKEDRIRDRLIGAAVILAGTVLLAI